MTQHYQQQNVIFQIINLNSATKKKKLHYLGGVRTSPMALTLLPRTNIPMGIPLRFGQLLML